MKYLNRFAFFFRNNCLLQCTLDFSFSNICWTLFSWITVFFANFHFMRFPGFCVNIPVFYFYYHHFQRISHSANVDTAWIKCFLFLGLASKRFMIIIFDEFPPFVREYDSKFYETGWFAVRFTIKNQRFLCPQ